MSVETAPPEEEYRQLCRARLAHLVPVREPLVLVSQIQRSGGTLLSQLFDGHPECHAHPHELWIGYPTSRDWPPLALDRPGDWFPMLFEKKVAKHLRSGYRKSSPSRVEAPDLFPFLLLPRLQHTIFEQCVASRAIERERDILDCYFTAYFNAWLDNHNLYTGPKKVVTGFVPRLAMSPDNVARYVAAYPDGTLISIVRDPRSWYESARRQRPERYSDVERALSLWRRSTEAAVSARDTLGDRVLLVTYDDLVLETERTMARIAERIGIAMSPVLLEPTFNLRPIRANSSGRVREHGILTARVDAYRESLDADTLARIDALAGDLYERAAAAT